MSLCRVATCAANPLGYVNFKCVFWNQTKNEIDIYFYTTMSDDYVGYAGDSEPESSEDSDVGNTEELVTTGNHGSRVKRSYARQLRARSRWRACLRCLCPFWMSIYGL